MDQGYPFCVHGQLPIASVDGMHAGHAVHSREDMRDKCILRLGELHAVFAHIRAIGALIVCSGLEDAWIEAEWFI